MMDKVETAEAKVRRLVRRCGRAVEALYGQAVDKGAAREELREVVRVVDGLARLAIAAADVRGTIYDLRCGSEAPTAQEDFRPVSGGDAGGGSLTSRGGESATGFMTSQGGSCNRTEAP